MPSPLLSLLQPSTQMPGGASGMKVFQVAWRRISSFGFLKTRVEWPKGVSLKRGHQIYRLFSFLGLSQQGTQRPERRVCPVWMGGGNFMFVQPRIFQTLSVLTSSQQAFLKLTREGFACFFFYHYSHAAEEEAFTNYHQENKTTHGNTNHNFYQSLNKRVLIWAVSDFTELLFIFMVQKPLPRP